MKSRVPLPLLVMVWMCLPHVKLSVNVTPRKLLASSVSSIYVHTANFKTVLRIDQGLQHELDNWTHGGYDKRREHPKEPVQAYTLI